LNKKVEKDKERQNLTIPKFSQASVKLVHKSTKMRESMYVWMLQINS